MAHAPYENLFKVVVLGNPGVGKTSLIMRQSLGTFDNTESQIAKIGPEFYMTSVNQGKDKLQIIDQSGEDRRFSSISSKYMYRGARAFVIAFDTLTEDVEKNIYDYWLSNLKSKINDNVPVILVSTKSDLQWVNETMAENFAQKMAKKYAQPISYFGSTSALLNDNVNNCFEYVASEVKKYQRETELPSYTHTGFFTPTKEMIIGGCMTGVGVAGIAILAALLITSTLHLTILAIALTTAFGLLAIAGIGLVTHGGISYQPSLQG